MNYRILGLSGAVMLSVSGIAWADEPHIHADNATSPLNEGYSFSCNNTGF